MTEVHSFKERKGCYSLNRHAERIKQELLHRLQRQKSFTASFARLYLASTFSIAHKRFVQICLVLFCQTVAVTGEPKTGEVNSTNAISQNIKSNGVRHIRFIQKRIWINILAILSASWLFYLLLLYFPLSITNRFYLTLVRVRHTRFPFREHGRLSLHSFQHEEIKKLLIWRDLL